MGRGGERASSTTIRFEPLSIVSAAAIGVLAGTVDQLAPPSPAEALISSIEWRFPFPLVFHMPLISSQDPPDRSTVRSARPSDISLRRSLPPYAAPRCRRTSADKGSSLVTPFVRVIMQCHPPNATLCRRHPPGIKRCSRPPDIRVERRLHLRSIPVAPPSEPTSAIASFNASIERRAPLPFPLSMPAISFQVPRGWSALSTALPSGRRSSWILPPG